METDRQSSVSPSQSSFFPLLWPFPPPRPPMCVNCKHEFVCVCVCLVALAWMLNGSCLLPLRLHVSSVSCTSVAEIKAHVCLRVWGFGWGRGSEGLRQTSPTLAGGESIIISFPGERCSEHQLSASRCLHASLPAAAWALVCVCAWTLLHPRHTPSHMYRGSAAPCAGDEARLFIFSYFLRLEVWVQFNVNQAIKTRNMWTAGEDFQSRRWEFL